MGVHQRVDRLARRTLKRHIQDDFFPGIREILHFEGNNGPDALKRKSPGVDEPWHFVDPEQVIGSELMNQIEDHIHNLAVALKGRDEERAAFEAAWLAHAVTDGLTPAHHYPFEEKLLELRGEDLTTRISAKEKLVMPGKTKREQLRNNWKYWGTKGLMITHVGFEHGIMTVVGAHKFDVVNIHPRQRMLLDNQGYGELYEAAVQYIDSLGMYEEFSRKGWTRRLAKQTRELLIPKIVELVTLAWLEAIRRSKTL